MVDGCATCGNMRIKFVFARHRKIFLNSERKCVESTSIKTAPPFSALLGGYLVHQVPFFVKIIAKRLIDHVAKLSLRCSSRQLFELVSAMEYFTVVGARVLSFCLIVQINNIRVLM